MRNLWKAEILKISRSFNYKLLLFFTFILGISYGRFIISRMSTATGMDIFPMIGTDILYNAVLICIFAADYIGSEFTNRTFASDISHGASREKLFGAKSVVFFIGLFPLVLLHDLTAICMLTVKNGFGIEWGRNVFIFVVNRILCGILCNAAMGSYILFVVFLVKNKIETVGIGIGSIYVLTIIDENIHNPDFFKILRFTFVYQLNDLRYGYHVIQNPFWVVAVSSFITVCIWMLAALWIFQRSDLK